MDYTFVFDRNQVSSGKMYTVKTYLDRSSIAGVGVFAGENVPKGTVIWTMVEGFDRVFTAEQFASFPVRAQEHIRRHGYLHRGVFYLDADHGPFTNHSDNPNSVTLSQKEIVASRDIKKGEEITCNYYEFDEETEYKLSFAA